MNWDEHHIMTLFLSHKYGAGVSLYYRDLLCHSWEVGNVYEFVFIFSLLVKLFFYCLFCVTFGWGICYFILSLLFYTWSLITYTVWLKN